MRVSIDQELCTGCGLCAESVPDVFEMGEDFARVKKPTVKGSLAEEVSDAADDCPAEAIIIED